MSFVASAMPVFGAGLWWAIFGLRSSVVSKMETTAAGAQMVNVSKVDARFAARMPAAFINDTSLSVFLLFLLLFM